MDFVDPDPAASPAVTLRRRKPQTLSEKLQTHIASPDENESKGTIDSDRSYRNSNIHQKKRISSSKVDLRDSSSSKSMIARHVDHDDDSNADEDSEEYLHVKLPQAEKQEILGKIDSTLGETNIILTYVYSMCIVIVNPLYC